MERQEAPRRERRQGVRPPEPLTRELIVTTASRMVESDGADAVTLRRLARELDVSNSALAWHVGDRPRLLALVGAAWLASISVPPADREWTEWLGSVANAYRSAAQAHPHLARLALDGFAVLPASSTASLPHALLDGLAASGLDAATSAEISNVAIAAVVGFVALELARGDVPAHDAPDAADQEHGAAVFGIATGPVPFDQSFVSLVGVLRNSLGRIDVRSTTDA